MSDMIMNLTTPIVQSNLEANLMVKHTQNALSGTAIILVSK